MPDQPKTPHRTVRIPDELWQESLHYAHLAGETVSDVIRRALERYVRQQRRCREQEK